MACTIQFEWPSGGVAPVVKLSTEASDTVVNGAGDTAVESATMPGWWTITVAETLSGLHKMSIDAGDGSMLVDITDGVLNTAGAAGNIYQGKASWFDDDAAATPTDRYQIIWHKNGQPITSGITLPLIQVYSAAGVDLITSTAMTQIGSTGTYKYDATGVARVLDGVGYQAKFSATIDGQVRTWYLPVGRDS